ncbi:hypothetical protein Bca4012_075932 [Brassica carinata]
MKSFVTLPPDLIDNRLPGEDGEVLVLVGSRKGQERVRHIRPVSGGAVHVETIRKSQPDGGGKRAVEVEMVSGFVSLVAEQAEGVSL